MNTHDFLSVLLPTEGKYCAFTMKGQMKKNIFVDDVSNLQTTIDALDKTGTNAWFALSTFDGEGFRRAENSVYIRSIFMDLDCGVSPTTGKPRDFPTKRAAVEQLDAFLAATGLGELGDPWLVDSGNGVHAYWPLDDDVTIAEWKPVVIALKQAADTHKFPIDFSVTSDAARVLRMPGAHNHKYSPPRPILLRRTGDIFSLKDIALCLPEAEVLFSPKPSTALALLGTRPTSRTLSPVAAAMAGNSVTHFKNIMMRTAKGTGCEQLAYYVDHAGDDGMEPLWRAMLSLTTVCTDGVKAALKLSALHPYDVSRMQQKLGEIKGPYTCASFDSVNPGVCKDCRHYRKITTPLVLGREVLMDTSEKEVKVDEVSAPLMRPTPPQGFYYGKKGGVYATIKSTKKDEEDVELMLTNYDLFMTRMFRDGSERIAEFVSVKGDTTQTFGIPISVVTSIADTVKALAAYNVIAVKGLGADPYLHRYVRACITEASMEGKEVPVPPRLGWQPDGSFAVGDTLYNAQGRGQDYTYKSERLHNVIEITRPQGTLEEWRSVMYMLRDKAVNTPRLWGHMSLALSGFATALMKFGPAGARAATIHITGSTSSAGKTLAMRMAASVWGDPSKYIIQSSTSERTMMQRAGLLGSLQLSVDEVTQKSRSTANEWLYNYLYDFAAGSHKIKGSATGNAEIAHECTWESLSTVSSNSPALETMMGARETTSHGEVKRFLEWYLPKGWAIVWEKHERELLPVLDRNFGVAGREWAKWLVENPETAARVWKEVETRWRAVAAADDTERFWTTTIVSSIAAAILLGKQHANILDIPASPLEAHWLQVVNSMRKVIDSNRRTAIDILQAFTREFNAGMVQFQQNILLSHLGMSPNSSVKGAIRGRVERDVVAGMVDYYIEIKMLKIHCAKMNQSFLEFQQELETVASVSECRRDLLAGTPGPTMRVNCLKISCPAGVVEDGKL